MRLVASVCLCVCGYVTMSELSCLNTFTIISPRYLCVCLWTVAVSTGCAIAVDHAFNIGRVNRPWWSHDHNKMDLEFPSIGSTWRRRCKAPGNQTVAEIRMDFNVYGTMSPSGNFQWDMTHVDTQYQCMSPCPKKVKGHIVPARHFPIWDTWNQNGTMSPCPGPSDLCSWVKLPRQPTFTHWALSKSTKDRLFCHTR